MIFLCANCGVELPSDGIYDCLIVHDITSDGDALTLRFGRACGCAKAILTAGRMKDRVDKGLPLGSIVDAKRR